MRQFHSDGGQPAIGQVFVFGSNEDGAHLGGAARAAFEQYGAAWAVAEGRTGHSYAIPTVASGLVAGALPLDAIGAAVARFIEYAAAHPHLRFFVTRIGCGIAGHRNADIAPMFATAPSNCSLPDTWAAILATNPKE
ncbi:A1S_2505 family phage non-structural protein [Achromobacter pestifer]|uniref:Uncharacterized protein n=1 Tax=Achromobacter pestifer TaxID=1353889 RepID=A0A6S6YH69_9BURK|nr:hypothetical protein [Achromobacter pestifer]CAB3624498.1 hypothetical protein LMG3431_00025 [Achromobacter pestifer]